MKTRFLEKAQSSCYQVGEPSKIYPFHKSASLAMIERAQLSPGHSPWSTTDARVLQPYQALRARSALLSRFKFRTSRLLQRNVLVPFSARSYWIFHVCKIKQTYITLLSLAHYNQYLWCGESQMVELRQVNQSYHDTHAYSVADES